MNLYKLLGQELRLLFNDLFQEERSFAALQRMERIVKMADQMGSPMQEEARRLQLDIETYLHNPNDKRAREQVKEHGLRLERETRQL